MWLPNMVNIESMCVVYRLQDWQHHINIACGVSWSSSWTVEMNKGNPTGYTAVPSTTCPPTVDTEDYQPAAPSYPQFPSAQPPPAYYDDPASKLFVQFTLKTVQRISFFVIGYSSAIRSLLNQTTFFFFFYIRAFFPPEYRRNKWSGSRD